MDCANRIRELRKNAHMTQAELSAKLGVSKQAISKWESGAIVPSTQKVFALCELFHVAPEELFSTDSVRSAQKASGMKSLKELYKIGRGPSSSHTMGPERACILFSQNHPEAHAFRVTLYGSLAKTGVGHGTDEVIRKTLAPKKAEVVLNTNEAAIPHPNTMDLEALDGNGNVTDKARVMSVGGGIVEFENSPLADSPTVYPHASFDEIQAYCNEKGMDLADYVEAFEGTEIWEYLGLIWETMKKSVEDGLKATGILPGGLNIQRKARILISRKHIDESAETRENRMVAAYAFAVSEQNACGERIVTAPTCGAAGVLPAVLYYEQVKRGYRDQEILRALATAGIIGNLIKTNASISGAECGCQAEIGSACAMAAAGLAELFGLDFSHMEYAAEISIEHHLGLTCDPINGLVQVPCIERNAVAAMRAINAVSLASFLSDTRRISLDHVIHTMKETGLDISRRYKETSEAGLAKLRI